MSSFFKKTKLLIIKLLNKGLLERIVPAFLALQFPLSPLSLRFAMRMPARSGLNENYFAFFYYVALNKTVFEKLNLYLKINKSAVCLTK